jgi:formylglycine-generating enzyme required for sulfatase activity
LSKVGVPGHLASSKHIIIKEAYRWRGDFDPDNANIETIIGSTSAVGWFPLGESPYGISDMSGNVYECTRSISKDYPYRRDKDHEDLPCGEDRVLRGGCFDVRSGSVRCAFRLRDLPDDWASSIGFRVVVSPNASLWSLIALYSGALNR